MCFQKEKEVFACGENIRTTSDLKENNIVIRFEIIKNIWKLRFEYKISIEHQILSDLVG